MQQPTFLVSVKIRCVGLSTVPTSLSLHILLSLRPILCHHRRRRLSISLYLPPFPSPSTLLSHRPHTAQHQGSVLCRSCTRRHQGRGGSPVGAPGVRFSSLAADSAPSRRHLPLAAASACAPPPSRWPSGRPPRASCSINQRTQ